MGVLLHGSEHIIQQEAYALVSNESIIQSEENRKTLREYTNILITHHKINSQHLRNLVNQTLKDIEKFQLSEIGSLATGAILQYGDESMIFSILFTLLSNRLIKNYKLDKLDARCMAIDMLFDARSQRLSPSRVRRDLDRDHIHDGGKT